jgi:hypothetical protein
VKAHRREAGNDIGEQAGYGVQTLLPKRRASGPSAAMSPTAVKCESEADAVANVPGEHEADGAGHEDVADVPDAVPKQVPHDFEVDPGGSEPRRTLSGLPERRDHALALEGEVGKAQQCHREADGGDRGGDAEDAPAVQAAPPVERGDPVGAVAQHLPVAIERRRGFVVR